MFPRKNISQVFHENIDIYPKEYKKLNKGRTAAQFFGINFFIFKYFISIKTTS
jgi:hypothetical protein